MTAQQLTALSEDLNVDITVQRDKAAGGFILTGYVGHGHLFFTTADDSDAALDLINDAASLEHGYRHSVVDDAPAAVLAHEQLVNLLATAPVPQTASRQLPAGTWLSF